MCVDSVCAKEKERGRGGLQPPTALDPKHKSFDTNAEQVKGRAHPELLSREEVWSREEQVKGRACAHPELPRALFLALLLTHKHAEQVEERAHPEPSRRFAERMLR